MGCNVAHPSGRQHLRRPTTSGDILERLITRSEYTGRTRCDANQSPLHGLHSKRRLAELLRITPKQLSQLVRAPPRDFTGMPIFRKGQLVLRKDGKQRLAEVPLPHLRHVHRRLLDLFSRILVPSYVHCSVKRRPYISNAAAHLRPGDAAVLDLKQFYPSVKLRHVFTGLSNMFQCSRDVAFCLARLCTCEGHVPTGSCISARIAYYAHKELFDSLFAQALGCGLIFTLHMDDLTVSGSSGVIKFMQITKSRLRRAELDYRERGRYAAAQCKKITGVIVTSRRLALPNARRKAVLDCIERLEHAVDAEDRRLLSAELLGRLGEARQVDHQFLCAIANRLRARSGTSSL